MQATIKTPVRFKGKGLHSGAPVSVVVHPAAAQFGIWFKRIDVVSDGLIAARWDLVDENTRLCTRLTNSAGVSVSTVEHMMAALAGCGIHNALIEVDGPELPILDGSSKPFVEALYRAGTRQLDAPLRALEILKPVSVSAGDSRASLVPGETLSIDFSIDFDDAAIGQQRKALNMANGSFVRELCDSRTFCRNRDVKEMRANGLALGGTMDNAVVVDGADVLNPGGLRHEDEAVRHKMLDALGDLALAGAPILGRYTGVKAGHWLTNQLLRQLFTEPGNCRFVECDAAMVAKLPGVGLHADDIPAVA